MLRLLAWLLRLVVVGPKPRQLAACECRAPDNPFSPRLPAFGLCESGFCERCCGAYCACKKAHVKAVLAARKEVER